MILKTLYFKSTYHNHPIPWWVGKILAPGRLTFWNVIESTVVASDGKTRIAKLVIVIATITDKEIKTLNFKTLLFGGKWKL